MFRLFRKKCSICKKDIDQEVKEGKAIVRFDRHFCSEEHAEEYRRKQAQEQNKKHHGCCPH